MLWGHPSQHCTDQAGSCCLVTVDWGCLWLWQGKCEASAFKIGKRMVPVICHYAKGRRQGQGENRLPLPNCHLGPGLASMFSSLWCTVPELLTMWARQGQDTRAWLLFSLGTHRSLRHDRCTGWFCVSTWHKLALSQRKEPPLRKYLHESQLYSILSISDQG